MKKFTGRPQSANARLQSQTSGVIFGPHQSLDEPEAMLLGESIMGDAEFEKSISSTPMSSSSSTISTALSLSRPSTVVSSYVPVTFLQTMQTSVSSQVSDSVQPKTGSLKQNIFITQRQPQFEEMSFSFDSTTGSSVATQSFIGGTKKATYISQRRPQSFGETLDSTTESMSRLTLSKS